MDREMRQVLAATGRIRCKSAPRCANTRGHGKGTGVPMRAQDCRPCECGCGRLTKYPGALYVSGHNRRAKKPYEVSDSGCWLWLGRLGSNGYASIKRDGRSTVAHRFYYEQHVGPVPEGMQLDHLCRVRHCVNPEHLEPVTQAENIRRGAAAKLTWDDVAAIRASDERPGDLSRRYGISRAQVWAIRSYSDWAEPGTPKVSLKRWISDHEVAEIRRLAEEGWTRVATARKFGISEGYVREIVKRRSRP